MSAGPSVLQDASWQDRCFIDIRDEAGNVYSFAGLTNELDLPDISKDFSAEPVMNGGHVRENDAQEPAEVGLTLYPIGSEAGDGTSRPDGIAEFFYKGETGDSGTGEATQYTSTLSREDFDIAVLWTNTSLSGTAFDSVSGEADERARREVYLNAQLTGFNPDFGDQILTVEATFKSAAYDETGSSNQFVDASADLSTTGLASVTSS